MTDFKPEGQLINSPVNREFLRSQSSKNQTGA